MRRKLNQKGIALSTILILGVAAVGTVAYFNVRVQGVNSQVMHILRRLSMWIDTQVYSIASFAYSIFYELSSSSLLSSLNLASASQRLYTLIGIFMLFRLAFSFVKYIINPEGMEKGTSKLLSNLAISLALIVSVPWIFNRAFVLQTYIMDSNVIGNLIMGMDTSNKKQTFNAGSYGQSIAFLTFSAFFRPNYSAIPSLSPCSNLLTYYSDDLEIENGDNGLPSLTPKNISDNELYKLNELIAQCVNNLNELQYTVDGTSSSVEIGTYFYIASQRQDIGLFSMEEILSAVVSGEYVVSYTGVVSTIAGGFLALLFLNFSFDVAIRNVKLCFMQIIAPIPIILNIEPGDSKGDKKSLNWWVKESLKAYTDLFIRVATVYFGVYLINLLFGQSTVAGSTNSSVWFQVFMILGILVFVKQIPDLIGKAFGIDVKGQFSLNPLKRIGDSRLASMAVGGAIGGATGLLNSGVAAYAGARSNGASRGEAIRRAITGGIGGAAHSTISGAKKGVKSIHDITGNVKENLARSGRIAGANVGTTFGGRMSAGMAMRFNAPTQSDIIDKQVKALKAPEETYGKLSDIAFKSKEDIGIRRFTSGGMEITSSKGLDHLIPMLNQQRNDAVARRASEEELSKIDETIKQYRSKEYRDAVDSGRIRVHYGDISGTGFSNVKDAHDYVERLKASGASVNEIKAAEDMTSAFVMNFIDTFKDDKNHAAGAEWAQYEKKLHDNPGIMRKNNIEVASDAASLKAQITASKNAAASLELSDKADRAARAKRAVQAKKGK